MGKLYNGKGQTNFAASFNRAPRFTLEKEKDAVPGVGAYTLPMPKSKVQDGEQIFRREKRFINKDSRDNNASLGVFFPNAFDKVNGRIQIGKTATFSRLPRFGPARKGNKIPSALSYSPNYNTYLTKSPSGTFGKTARFATGEKGELGLLSPGPTFHPDFNKYQGDGLRSNRCNSVFNRGKVHGSDESTNTRGPDFNPGSTNNLRHGTMSRAARY